MKPAGFYLFLGFTIVVLIGLSFPLPWTLLPVVFVFILIPLFDYLLPIDIHHLNSQQVEELKQKKYWSLPLLIYFFIHFLILIYGGRAVVTNNSWVHTIAISFVVGLFTGGVGITVAHELCHKKSFKLRLMADFLLASVCYQHFAVEHVRGHHLNVATPLDPASAHRDETSYAFILRSISQGFRHALQLDARYVLFGFGLSVLMALLSAYFGLLVLMYFLLQAATAMVLLELVNYIEHYGLNRKQLSNGKYEKVLPVHSWNSSHRFSNYLLFNLQRHSDHHANAALPYTALQHQPSAPQLPSGYPGMILISLIPKVWFRMMNGRLDQLSSDSNR
jgi:alkane 1-monooxygenase